MLKSNQSHHLYGFTDLKTLNERGPVVITHGKGIYVYDIHEKKCPKLDNVENFIFVIELLQSMHEKNKIVSYHDISDGGLLTTIAECCFAGHTGMSINIDKNFEINKFLT